MRAIIALGWMMGAVASFSAATDASALVLVTSPADACHRSARHYETRCLMPRIEARLRFAEGGDAPGFVERMRAIDQSCADVTAAGLAACVTWPRVRPTTEYRRWLRDVRETWERRQVETDGMRPACPPGAANCL